MLVTILDVDDKCHQFLKRFLLYILVYIQPVNILQIYFPKIKFSLKSVTESTGDVITKSKSATARLHINTEIFLISNIGGVTLDGRSLTFCH